MKAHKVLWHGVDTAKVGYIVTWPSGFEKELARFRVLREQAQHLGGGNFEEWVPLVTLGNCPISFTARPMGARMLPFAFESAGVIVFIGDTMGAWQSGKKRQGVTPNVRVEFQPWSVAREGLAKVHEFALRLLRGMGGNVEGNLLSEVHMTADIETDRPHKASDYHTGIDGLWRKVRTKLRTNGQAHEVDTDVDTIDIRADTAGPRLKQVNIGKDKKMLRVYDKLLELKTHPDKAFEGTLWNSPELRNYVCREFGTAEPSTSVMRVEYQLRRERLLERELSAVEDFLEWQGPLWKHLTEEFVCMIEDDDSNRTRCSVQPWWKVVQGAWEQVGNEQLPKRLKTKPDFKKYVDQSMGLITTMGARLGCEHEGQQIDLQDIIDIARTVWEATHDVPWAEVMRKKRERFDVLWGDLPEASPEEQSKEETQGDSHPDSQMNNPDSVT